MQMDTVHNYNLASLLILLILHILYSLLYPTTAGANVSVAGL